MLSTTDMRFRRGQVGARQLHGEVQLALRELDDPDSDAARRAREMGLGATTLADAKVVLVEEQQGLDPVTTTILVTIMTELGAHAAATLWDVIILPRLKRKFGIRALGEKVDS
jgi:hypothetical protein